MAGDWIKMRCNLQTDPRVLQMAAILKLAPLDIVGRLHAVWSWADAHSVDGNAVCVTYSALDGIAGNTTGFAEGLESVGWLRNSDATGACLTFPNFEEHNGRTAKKRAQTAKRVAQHKAGNGNARVTPGALPREEKRREDIKNNQKKPKDKKKGKTVDRFAGFWDVVHRKEAKGVAEVAFNKACQKVSNEKGKSLDEAGLWLIERMAIFAKSAQAKDAVKGTLHPATWLNQARYDDDAAIWNGNNTSATKVPFLPPRRKKVSS